MVDLNTATWPTSAGPAPAWLPGPPPAWQPSTPEDFATMSLNALRGQGMPMWGGGLWSALAQLMQRLNASPQGVLGATAPQANQAATAAQGQKKQVKQKLGPMGGGQTGRAESGIDAQLSELLANLFGQVPGQAQGVLGNIATAFSRPIAPTPSTQTSIATQQIPGDPMQAAQALFGLGYLGTSLGKGAYNLWQQPILSAPYQPYAGPLMNP